MLIKELFIKVVTKGASDLFLHADGLPRARINGVVHVLDDKVISRDEVIKIADFLLATDERRQHYALKLDIEFIHDEPGVGRFRVNILKQRGSPGIVARHVIGEFKTFEELNLPAELCERFSQESRGLILMCGPAGNGKSTTIASMLEYINKKFEKHIVTIEDPIEFLFSDKKSIINQRELGLDVHSYPVALRHVTQQSPDIIYIGNIRDQNTMQAALTATELGALVISTLHTINATQTLERMINFFPPHLHAEVRMELSLILKGVMSLRLVPLQDGTGRVPAYETMVVTPTIARLIREGSIKEIQSFIDKGDLFGMQSFKRSLVGLVRKGLVREEDARQVADSRDEFDLALKGVDRIE
jgi:twitching motility protein PilT